MSPPDSLADVLVALREFVARIDALEPEAQPLGALTVELNGLAERLELSGPVASALLEALLSYQDPRDRGTCAHCGSPRLDDYFMCKDCGVTNGVYGQVLAERAARFQEDALYER